MTDNKELNDYFHSLLNKMNEQNQIMYIFEFKGIYYFTEWSQWCRWSDPIKITKIN